jgi:signal peptidase I
MSSTEAAKPSAKSVFWENVQTILLALVLAMVIRFAAVQPFRIPSGSMQPTLQVGDYILVTKWSYGYSRFSAIALPGPHGRFLARQPKRGEVIVFRPPPDESSDFIKRLIGLPGDTIQVRDSVLYINGQPVKRQYVDTIAFKDGQTGQIERLPRFREELPNGVSYITFARPDRQAQFGLEPCDGRRIACDIDNTVKFVVPPGHYFFMGDDRDNSADSRTPTVGYVPFENLVGHAQFVVISWDPQKTSLFLPWTWITGLRGDRFFKSVS